MNMFSDFHQRIVKILERLKSKGQYSILEERAFLVEPPRDPAHGDISTNLVLIYAKDLQKNNINRMDFAALLQTELEADEDVVRTELAGPGFINIWLKSSYLETLMQDLLRAGDTYGQPDDTKKQPINIEYVSANPTGPMHVGHCRGAVFGDALANLLGFYGAPITREYYINDAGAQVDVLAKSAYLRYCEALGQEIGEIPEGLYPGDYLKPVGEKLAQEYGRTLLEKDEIIWLPLVRESAISEMMQMIREDLASLNIKHDVFFSERSLQGDGQGKNEVDAAIDDLQADGLIYKGTLPPPKGVDVKDWDQREQLLFKSTQFGDDSDRAIKKADGGYTYFASDIAYHRSKWRRGFPVMIDVWGADHGGYIKRMEAAVAALSHKQAQFDVKICQLVKLMRDGEPVKMSKRSGDFVTLREVVDEVGVDATRFMMLFRKNDATLEFDLAKVIDQSKENPVFYVQYAYARTCSVLKQTQQQYPEADLSTAALSNASFQKLEDIGENQLIRALVQYPRLIEAAATSHEPHRIAFYIHDLASQFHAHWNRGKENAHLRFINQENKELSMARIALVKSIGLVLKSGLTILGVSAPEEMR